MKKILLSITLLIAAFWGFAQAPQSFNYQAVIRNSTGAVVASQAVGARYTIREGSETGTILYRETQTLNTNQFGLVTHSVGTGTVVSGTFNSINWGSGAKYLQVEVDVAGGTAYVDMGATQLLSVPYALFSANGGVAGPTGPQGAQGPAGPQGATGNDGAQGPQGNDGPQGPTGNDGPQGIQGIDGPTGADGAQGPTGNDGPQGPQGIDGPTGPQGAQGIAGPTGPQGPQGAQGNAGAQGIAGPTGPQGAQGAQGSQGIAGPTGPQGSQGSQGNAGAQGIAGPTGPQGPQGAQGAQGNAGAQGIAGPTGPQGPQGAQGAQGNAGAQGIAGPTGPQGPQGAQGAQGLQGPVGAQGAQGSQGVQGIAGPTGPIGGANTQVIYNSSGTAAGSANHTWDNGTNTLTVTGTTSTTNATVTSLGGGGTRFVQTDNAGALSAVAFSGVTGTGTTNYHTKFTAANTIGNSIVQDNGTSLSIGATTPSVIYQAYVYRQQLTANGDGQASVYGYRTRDSQNDGTGYSQIQINSATTGFNFWGDVYTWGVAGINYNDYNRCGGTFGADVNGLYWGSLGYRSSGLLNYGVYGSSAYANGGGYLPSAATAGIGGGFFGNNVGLISRGSVIGQFNAGELFASYNVGDVYTSGRQIEMVNTGNEKTPAFAATSTESSVYKKGKAQMVNGSTYIKFDEAFVKLLGETPTVTITPMGNCAGVYIASIDKNGFTVKELNNGSSTVEVSWIAVGNRVDAAEATVPSELKDKEFDGKLLNSMFDDSNKEQSGQGMYWDGKNIKFGVVPAECSPKPKTEEEKKR
jgi:hypothetical protein